MIHDNEHIYGSKLLKNGSNSAINLKSKVNVKVLDEKKLLLKNKVL